MTLKDEIQAEMRANNARQVELRRELTRLAQEMEELTRGLLSICDEDEPR